MRQRGTLLLEVSEAGIAELAIADARVVLAKPAGKQPPNVAWMTLAPRPRTAIVWEDLYGVFASNTAVQIGAAIDVTSYVYPALARRVYTYDGARFAEARPEARIPRGHYDVWNAGPSPATFGLMQKAWVDGAVVSSLLNAIVLPTDFTADFTADERVYIWTQRDIAAGTVIREIPSAAVIARFNPRDRVHTYRYDVPGAAFTASL